MELAAYLRSVVEQDRCAVVICNTEHEVVYMNPAAAKRYEKSGGYSLVGGSLLDCHNAASGAIIEKVLDWFRASEENNIMYTYRNEKENKDVYMVALRDETKKLIGYYEKHEYRSRETAKCYDFG